MSCIHGFSILVTESQVVGIMKHHSFPITPFGHDLLGNTLSKSGSQMQFLDYGDGFKTIIYS